VYHQKAVVFQVIPAQFSSLDVNRNTLSFFAINGLDLLNRLDDIKISRSEMVEWIYALQVLPTYK